MRLLLPLLLAGLAACQSNANDPANNVSSETTNNTSQNNTIAQNNTTSSTNNTAGTQNNVTTPTGCGDATEVTFETTDGVDIVADFHPAPQANRGAVVLLHMIPPGNDRSTYPPRVRQAFADLGLNVLNIDRRGAGDSGGTARDAYTGETASLDAEAGVAFLLDDARACAVDGTKLMLIGASNGTTSVFDYTVSRQNTDLPAPAAMAWLSPGTYTESQNSLDDNPLAELPLLIVHPDNEPWATELTAPVPWKIVEIENGQHGTQNFDNGAREAVQLTELVEWATANVGP